MRQTLHSQAKAWFRSAFYPGVNLHARDRYITLPKFFASVEPGSEMHVLDAGSGNGMLAYKSYRNGARVTGVSFRDEEVRKARDLFNVAKAIPSTHLRFEQKNLYELDFPAGSFDEIICSEVIEHLQRDQFVCRKFFELLKPGGVLHLCAPNAEHPYNATFPLDKTESGGHVRPGYTLESYRALLEPLGFQITASAGLGGPVRQAFNRRIKEIQARVGAAAGVPLFFVALPFLWIDRLTPLRVPFSLYVRARKLTREAP